MRGFVKRHSLEEVIKVLKKRIKITGSVKLPFDKSLGYVLAEDVISDRNVPSFNRSAMDGFAVMAKDTFGASGNNPIALEVTGEITAGTIKKIGIKENQCARIMTGAPLPANADAVIMAEYTEEQSDNIVKIFSSVSPGKNVSLIGEDIKEMEQDMGEDVESKWGLCAGGFVRFNISKVFAIQPEVLYTMKGAKIEGVIPREGTFRLEYKLSYLEVPVLVKFMMPTPGSVKPNLYAGPAVAIKLSAKGKIEAPGITAEEDIEGMKDTDFGLIVGAGH